MELYRFHRYTCIMCTRTVHVHPPPKSSAHWRASQQLDVCPLPLLATPSSLEMLFGIGPSSNQHKRPRTPLSKKSDSKTSIATSSLGKDQSDSEMPPSPAISKLKEVVEDVYEEIKSLKEKLKSAEEEAAKWKAQNATTETSFEARGKYAEQLNLELTKMKSDRGRLQKDFERLSGELDSVRKERDKALQECGKFQAETEAVKKEWNKAQQERLRLQKRSDSLKRERDAFEKQYEVCPSLRSSINARHQCTSATQNIEIRTI